MRSLRPRGSLPGQYWAAAVWSTIITPRRLGIVGVGEGAALDDGNSHGGKVSGGDIGAGHLARFVRLGHIPFRPYVAGFAAQAERQPVGQRDLGHAGKFARACQDLLLELPDLGAGISGVEANGWQ